MRLSFSLLFILLCCIFNYTQAGTPEPSPENYELRLQRLENTLSGSGLLDLFQRLESLQQEVNELKGELEVQNHRQEKLSARHEKQINHLNEKITSLETKLNSVHETQQMDPQDSSEIQQEDLILTTSEQEPGETPQNTEVITVNEQQTDEESKQAYQNAFNLLKDSKYSEASSAFNSFLENYPSSYYADSAQYWLAETYFVLRDFESAKQAYQALIDTYPESRKLPHGYLKLAYAYEELEEIELAKETLNNLINQFPGTPVSQEAADRLQSLAGNSEQE